MDSSSAVTSAVVLAGGLGTRLRHAIPDLPKPMAPIKGRPFLEYQLDHWIGEGIRHFVLSVGYRREVIMGHFGDHYKGARIDYAIEETPLGTGGGLMLALPRLNPDAPFLLLNGDTFFDVKFRELLELHRKFKADWTFSLFRTHEKERYLGMKIDESGRVLSLRAEPSQNELHANGGVYLVNPRSLSLPEWAPGKKLSLENEILPVLLARGARFWGFVASGRFIDIGLPDDYLRSSDILPV